MPFRQIPGQNTRYALMSFDSKGQERQDDPDGLMSEKLLALAQSGEVTNIFWFSHGWMGDVPAAIRQYDLWIGSFDSLAPDRDRAVQTYPGFRPLYIGMHWPSLPWGDEELAEASFDASGAPDPRALESAYAERVGVTPAAREALSSIFEEARRNSAADTLSPRAAEALSTLHRELQLDDSDTDGIPFDPEAMCDGEVSFGAVSGGVLSVLRSLSYWTMKKRARTIGEGALHDFLNRLQRTNKAVRIHLMGHSFGCVLTSAALGGPGGSGPLDRPVDSVALVQGAVSLWSYAPLIPMTGGPGYFSRIVPDRKVRGPLIITRSKYDLAVNRPYAMASRVSGAIAFGPDDYPAYGAIGRFGLRGLPEEGCCDTPMCAVDQPHKFEKGKLYNLEASQFICKMEGAAGAHNDIGGQQVAHAIWDAVIAAA